MEAIFSLWMRWLRHNATLTAPSPTTSGTTRTRFEEFWSAQRLADARGGRFSAHPRCWRDPECLIASVGEGQPVIALLGEFDARRDSASRPTARNRRLDTGSQRPAVGTPAGTAAFAAAVAAKGWLQQHGDSGTLRFYGCPGEEGGSGKPLWCAKGCLMMSMRR